MAMGFHRQYPGLGSQLGPGTISTAFSGSALVSIQAKNLAAAQRWFQKFGVWSLLLAWLPVAGDALTFIAGMMRVHFLVFIVLTAIGKATRYALLLGILEIFR